MEQILNKTLITYLFGIVLIVHAINCFVAIPVFPNLVFQSCVCVYIGCFMASKIVSKDNVQKRSLGQVDEEVLSEKDAAMFLVYGSATLYGIYTLYKIIPKEILSFIFTVHFTFLGLICLGQLIEIPFRQINPEKFVNNVIDKHFNIKLPMVTKAYEFDIKLNVGQIICLCIAAPNAVVYMASRYWLTNNIFGIAFSIIGIANMNLPNFKVGAILLWGLFFYDIFWVYGTDVMVSVAKQFDAPIKLLFPYDYSEETPKQSMLGLGDIIIPGIFVALALKYDIDQHLIKTKKVSLDKLQTPYFNWTFGGYVLGIVTTFIIMIVFNHPQPALLFLVPGVTGGCFAKALINKNIESVIKYEEKEHKEQKKE